MSSLLRDPIGKPFDHVWLVGSLPLNGLQHINLPISLNTCALISELPCNKSTMAAPLTGLYEKMNQDATRITNCKSKI